MKREQEETIKEELTKICSNLPNTNTILSKLTPEETLKIRMESIKSSKEIFEKIIKPAYFESNQSGRKQREKEIIELIENIDWFDVFTKCKNTGDLNTNFKFFLIKEIKKWRA